MPWLRLLKSKAYAGNTRDITNIRRKKAFSHYIKLSERALDATHVFWHPTSPDVFPQTLKRYPPANTLRHRIRAITSTSTGPYFSSLSRNLRSKQSYTPSTPRSSAQHIKSLLLPLVCTHDPRCKVNPPRAPRSHSPPKPHQDEDTQQASRPFKKRVRWVPVPSSHRQHHPRHRCQQ